MTNSEPPQIYGSNQIELAWTVIPILIVFVLILVTARTISDVQNATSTRRLAERDRGRPPVVVGNSLPGTWHRDGK